MQFKKRSQNLAGALRFILTYNQWLARSMCDTDSEAIHIACLENVHGASPSQLSTYEREMINYIQLYYIHV